MKENLRYLKPLIEQILRDPPGDRDWSVQGFGMLRTYFGPAGDHKRFRLNLWDSRFAVPGVSTIHDHPWHFKSIIVAGSFCNTRFKLIDQAETASRLSGGHATHHFTTIRTGEGGGPEKSPTQCCVLLAQRPELYGAGDEYNQEADEIHETIYRDGCVTLNERTRVGDGEHANVFWPYGEQWVDAEPREATLSEVKAATTSCLREWF